MNLASAESLFWIAIGALFVPMISRRLRIPSAVGELIYGMIFGPHLLGEIVPDEYIDFMSQLGFAILMFSAGMEIDFAPLRKRGSKLLSTAWIAVLLIAYFAVAGAILLDVNIWAVLAVCSLSIGLASAILKEKGLSGAPLGQIILATGLIGESASILVLTMLGVHFRLDFTVEFFESIGQFAGIFVLAYLMMRFFKFVIWWTPKKVAAFMESGDSLELGVRLAVAMLFIFLAAATLLGVEAILGAFIAGALFSYIFQEREVVSDKISAMGQGFFVPFFFIVVGSHFDPLNLLEAFSGMLFLKLMLLALGAKLIPALIFHRVDLSMRETIAAGLLLSAPLTLTIAVAELGVKQGAISNDLQGVLILVAITNGLVCPYLTRHILRRKEKE